MMEQRRDNEYTLRVPVEVSDIKDVEPGQAVKVAVRERDGSIKSETIRLGKDRKASAEFCFPKKPGLLKVVFGPDSASDDELFRLQTIDLDVSPRQWGTGQLLDLPPLHIPFFYWRWWIDWCRNITITGRVLCPDGRPAPGAKVCAYDVDWWWWWSSSQEVGCAVTDATGTFKITFRWCCGWWPWWWWQQRFWKLEPVLAGKILPKLQSDLTLNKLPIPSAKPSLAFFDELVSEQGISTREPLAEVDPTSLENLRKKLVDVLPVVPELERLRIWPWWPWYPWWDCTPDIIFKVTQNCEGEVLTIVDEGFSDTRWNIPTNLDVTLVANNEACCIPTNDDPAGICLVISHACDDLVKFIGGNPGAAPSPKGYRNPGVIATHGDRPYAGVVPISGQFGDLTNVDYYEFEWSATGGATWNDMPAAAAGGFSRWYFDSTTPANPFHVAYFPFTNISGRRVVESRQHFEKNNGFSSWGVTRFWVSNRDLLMRWITQNPDQSVNFPDHTYKLRVKSWEIDNQGDLINSIVLPLCGTQDKNGIVLTIDNRITGPGSGHPTSPTHVCGAGTVHTCTTEPDTDFIDIRINGTSVAPCDIIDATSGGPLEIDFMAHDPDGHLAFYTLHATYDENLSINLLALPGAILSAGPAGPVPPAAQVGPNYGSARSQGAVAPRWDGGTLTLAISNLKSAFPKSCAYQLELRAYKRTIASCNDSWPYRNRSEFSMTVKV